jgi:hypothetical protein
MLKRTRILVAAGALVLALPAGAALADSGDDVEDGLVAAVTCDQSQQQLRLVDGSGAQAGEQARAMVQTRSGECDGTGADQQLEAMAQKRAQARFQEQSGECDGDGDGPANGPRAGAGNGTGAGQGAGSAYRHGSNS